MLSIDLYAEPFKRNPHPFYAAMREAAPVYHYQHPDGFPLGFGFGLHYCLGAPLARLEGQIAFTTLLQRLPHLRLAVAPDALQWRTESIFLRGLRSLPVEWR